jgi:hypothetical protein
VVYRGTEAGSCLVSSRLKLHREDRSLLSEIETHLDLLPVLLVLLDIVQGAEVLLCKIESLVIILSQRLGIEFWSVAGLVVFVHVVEVVVGDGYVVSVLRA